MYIGTSGCTLHEGTLEHQSLTAKPTNNAQRKHHWSKHPNQQPIFTTEVIRSGIKYNTDRFIFEALKIEKARVDPNLNLLNQKSEWGNNGLVRLMVHNTG